MIYVLKQRSLSLHLVTTQRSSAAICWLSIQVSCTCGDIEFHHTSLPLSTPLPSPDSLCHTSCMHMYKQHTPSPSSSSNTEGCNGRAKTETHCKSQTSHTPHASTNWLDGSLHRTSHKLTVCTQQAVPERNGISDITLYTCQTSDCTHATQVTLQTFGNLLPTQL